MIAYQYGPEGQFIGTAECQRDPLESDRAGRDIFLTPAQSTTQKPPEVSDDEIVRWTGSLWVIEPKPEPAPMIVEADVD